MNASDILDKYNIQLEKTRFAKGGTELVALCPFHEDRHPSFSLNIERGVFNCFGCPAKGTVYDIVAEYTDLSASEARKAVEGDFPEYAHSVRRKKPARARGRYLTEAEIDMLTSYAMGLHESLMRAATKWREYLTEERGLSLDAITYFKLGANATKNYNAQFIRSNSDRFAVYGSAWTRFLENANLVNRKGGDYYGYWRPAIIIPYSYDGRIYYLNGRILPGYDELIRYIGMSGITREVFFHEDALDHHDSLFVVEGELNAAKMWDSGIKNTVSFGGKNQLSDGLISRLYGKNVTLYFDTDQSDREFKQRSEAIQKLLKTARSVGYFELPQGIDPNDYLNQHSKEEFEDSILANIISVPPEAEFGPSEYKMIPDAECEAVISLSEARNITTQYMKHIGEHFAEYSGKRILVNMPVGTGKTMAAIDLIKTRNSSDRALVLASTHYNATAYDNSLGFQSLSLHLKGRGHPDMECEFANKAEFYATQGYSPRFRLKYCYGVCGKARELREGRAIAKLLDKPEREDMGCIYMRQLEAARTAEVLIATHAHAQLRDFLVNPYYGNHRRSLIIIDEEANLVQPVYFTKSIIEHNLRLFTDAASSREIDNGAREVAIDLSAFLIELEKHRAGAKGCEAAKSVFGGRSVYELDKFVCSMVKESSVQHPCRLHDLVYAMSQGLPFGYDDKKAAMFYVWRPVFPDNACIVFLSATTPKAYLESSLGIRLDEVMGERYHVKRDNLQVVQLLGIAGGRNRLLYDSVRQDSIKAFFELALKKHQKQRIMLITSQGAGIGLEADDTAKGRIISMLQPIAEKWNRNLVGVETSDLEARNVSGNFADIPVIHYGIRGTNLFADYDIAIELNAHYYHQDAIIDGVRNIFGLDISGSERVKQEAAFRTWDREYTIERYVHQDDKVRLFIQANQEADIQQTEGRILRGHDTPKVIYRLHNVNVRPYPDRVYKSWASLFREEFGQIEITGKMKDVLDWIQENVKTGEKFTTKQVCDAIGGYVWERNKRYMQPLEELGYISNVTSGGKGKGDKAKWIRVS